MAISNNASRWIAGICIGAVLTETLKAGSGAVVLLICTLLGRWLIGKLANNVFDDELAALKKRFAPSDPVKQQIWKHASEHHTGKFKDCREPACFL